MLKDSVPQQRTKTIHNLGRRAGLLRQGEWLFVPSPGFIPADKDLILHNEPIQRRDDVPYIVDQLYRHGGELVYVCPEYPVGLSEDIYHKLIARRPETLSRDWHVRRRNLEVYARGEVRHEDRKTIVLPYWHRVLMSSETGSLHMAFWE